MNLKTFPKPKEPFSCPESILFIHPDATYLEVDIDMLDTIVKRTNALLEVLTGYYQTPVKHRPSNLNDGFIIHYLWQISGNVKLIEQIAETSYSRLETTKQGKNAEHD